MEQAAASAVEQVDVSTLANPAFEVGAELTKSNLVAILYYEAHMAAAHTPSGGEACDVVTPVRAAFDKGVEEQLAAFDYSTFFVSVSTDASCHGYAEGTRGTKVAASMFVGSVGFMIMVALPDTP